MQAKTVGDLVHLSERQAVDRHFDAANYRNMRWLLAACLPFALASGLVGIGQSSPLSQLAWIPSLLLGLCMYLTRESRFFEQHGRRLTLLFLALLPAAAALSITAPEPAYGLVGYVAPALLLLFRFDRWQYLALMGLNLATTGWILWRLDTPEATGSRVGMGIGSLVVCGIILAVTLTVTRRRRREFLHQWHREVARERDSSRMRSELEDARAIQLSMLPDSEPELDWIDLASVSLPASEVGGDYFDYFQLADSKLAIVIADVAGHGMASGLVLSSVRSGLHLLREELHRPTEVLRKLDRMLRETVGGRIFVTLQIAVLDPGGGRITVANAGHPQLILASPDGRARRLGGSGLPLGTRLDAEFDEQTESIAAGDLLVLFSDGVPELRSFDGDEFGERRLLVQLRQALPRAEAALVRDDLLEALRRFKGEVEQLDDLTLVVARVGGDSAAGDSSS